MEPTGSRVSRKRESSQTVRAKAIRSSSAIASEAKIPTVIKKGNTIRAPSQKGGMNGNWRSTLNREGREKNSPVDPGNASSKPKENVQSGLASSKEYIEIGRWEGKERRTGKVRQKEKQTAAPILKKRCITKEGTRQILQEASRRRQDRLQRRSFEKQQRTTRIAI